MYNMFKAKRIDNGEWVEGWYVLKQNEALEQKEHHYILEHGEFGFAGREVDPETVCKCVGKEYMDSDIAWEGDIIESQVCGLLMVIRYGTYQAFCPVDKQFMDSVGFYAECKGFPDMPIGDLHDYALKKGNIFDNPELLEGGA